MIDPDNPWSGHDRLSQARMRAARARDMMAEAVTIARWRLSPDMIKSDARAKKNAFVQNLVAKPGALLRKHPAPAAGLLAITLMWVFRKPIGKALPDIATDIQTGIEEGARSLLSRTGLARTDLSHTSQEDHHGE